MQKPADIFQDDASSVINNFAQAHILCVGDVMLDRFIYGKVKRISPEAPIPVVAYESEKVMLGGAGNVVRNMSTLGGNTSFISVIGSDDTGKIIAGLTGEEKNVFPYLMADNSRISTEKTRYIAETQQLFRADREHIAQISNILEEKIFAVFCDEVEKNQIVVISDYGKGVVTPSLLRLMIDKANDLGIPIIIDPKSNDFSLYKGATLVSPNLAELEAASGNSLANDSEIAGAANELMQKHEIKNILVTKGAKGMTLLQSGKESFDIKARAREVFDVSGAGDTVLATMAISIAIGCSFEQATFLANVAAGIVVGKIGTATIFRTDLKAAIHTLDITTGKRKIFPRDIAADQVDAWKRDGLEIGFTNGCFDLIHSGHLSSLNCAKSNCDRLIVAINSDESVARLKGPERPVNNEMDRALLLAELQAVDMVVIFPEDTPENLLQKLRPDVLMKGEDYQKHEIVGAEFVESYGGKIFRIPLEEGYSTTSTISRIKNNG